MARRKLSSFLFVFFLVIGSLSQANEFHRPKTHRDLSDKTTITIEVASQVEGAMVVWANYAALRRDFPALTSLSEAEICKWLIKNFAYVGYLQKFMNGVRNTPIPFREGNPEPRFAFRAPGWIRAAMMEAQHPDGTGVIGMVDAKGFGHGALSVDLIANLIADYEKVKADPSLAAELLTRGHSDGLMTLGEAIAEVTRQQAAQELFEMSGLGFETVESYAILKMPFDVIRPGGEVVPAAMYLRQAHQGREQNLPVPKTIYTDERGKLQRTNMRTAIDFGGVIITDPRLNQNPETGISFAETEKDNPQTSYPWIWGHRLAWNVARQENPDLSGIYRHVDEMLAPLAKDYAESPLVAKRHQEQRALVRYILYLEKMGKTYEEIRNLILSRPKIQKTKFSQYEKFLDAADEEEFETAVLLLGTSRTPIPSTIGKKILTRAKTELKIILAPQLFNAKDEKQLAVIEMGLTESSDRIRSSAADALGGIKTQAAVELIARGLAHENSSWVKAGYVRSLAHRQDPLSLKTIFAVIDGSDSSLKAAAFSALEGRTEPENIPYLKRRVGSADEGREEALLALTTADPANAIDAIQNAVTRGQVSYTRKVQNYLTAQNNLKALQAVLAIQKAKRATDENIVQSIGEFTIPEALPLLLNFLSKKKEIHAVLETLRVLQRFPTINLTAELDRVLKNYGKDSTENRAIKKAVADYALARGTLIYRPYILSILNDDNSQVRFSVGSAAAKSAFKDDPEVIQKLLNDVEPDVRALGYLAQAGKESPEDIQKLIDNPRSSLKEAGLKLLLQRSDLATLPILQKYLADFDYSKKQMIQGYALRRGPESIEALRTFLSQNTHFVRQEAITALSKRDDAESIPLFEEIFALNDPSSTQAGVEALLKRSDPAAYAFKQKLLMDNESKLGGGLRYLILKSIEASPSPLAKCVTALTNLP